MLYSLPKSISNLMPTTLVLTPPWHRELYAKALKIYYPNFWCLLAIHHGHGFHISYLGSQWLGLSPVRVCI